MTPRKSKFAEGTDVPPEKSRSEIDRLLRRYGADQFHSGWDDRLGLSVVRFRYNGYMVRFEVPIPKPPDASEYRTTRQRKQDEAFVEREEMRLWRCLVLAIKSKLETVASDIETFEEAFLANIEIDGMTIAERIIPRLNEPGFRQLTSGGKA